MRHVLQTFLLSGIVLTLKITEYDSSPCDSRFRGEVLNFLEEYFDDYLIALDNPKDTGMDWPPYSPDLNPCDFSFFEQPKELSVSTTPYQD
ncbi:hypothetical protein AVEN_203195-1 [Araneus ventricosus]|uniref:Uncharacterized protein n=1 Tax=Araneus ventricosus TaxID=182803 RepID=A0A4Y2CH28_ARAVE|nr:hypothetical protein AVEN_203195-1 [Araneus ventricosus]